MPPRPAAGVEELVPFGTSEESRGVPVFGIDPLAIDVRLMGESSEISATEASTSFSP